MENNIYVLKDQIQRKALNLWYLKGCRASLNLATGIGKSRIGVLASQYVKERINPELQRNMLPVKYRKYLSEFN